MTNTEKTVTHTRKAIRQGTNAQAPNPLDTVFFDGHEREPVQPHAPPTAWTQWLSVEQIRKMERMRRSTVIAAMESGHLPFERRGRIRYARLSDILRWQEMRLTTPSGPSRRAVDPDLEDLLR